MVSPAESLTRRPLYVFDLPREILQTLEPAINAASQEPDPTPRDPKPTPPRSPALDGEAAKATSCALCTLSFPTVHDQRSHVRSDLHRYNLKQKMRGLKPVSEEDFDRLVGDLDESISGSDSSESDSDGEDTGPESKKTGEIKLNALLKRQAHISEPLSDAFSLTKRKRGSGKPPILWFKSTTLPENTTLGIYRVLFTQAEQEDESSLVPTLTSRQLAPQKPPAPASLLANPPDGGVTLPKEPPSAFNTPHIFMCMIGGGHFAAMIVALAPKLTKHAPDARQATVLAHKTFHRYTTRRKQGGSQAANDSAKGAAHSAGASIRRYNESALVSEVRALLAEWKAIIESSQLLFVRATGSANRSTLFGSSADDQARPLRPDDPRLRGFPFSTRRATEAELMRCFIELTRVKVREADLEAEACEAQEASDKARARTADEEARTSRSKEASAKKAADIAREQEAALHTTQLTALIRRSKAPALLAYLTANKLDASYPFHPPDSPAHYHAPTPLHLAASSNTPALVTALLAKAAADPTLRSPEGKTPFEVTGDRVTRDAFRLARTDLGEDRWDWDAAGVPPGISRDEVAARAERERLEAEAAETARRKDGLEQLAEQERRREGERGQRRDEDRERRSGKGRSLMGAGRPMTAEERRAEEARGMTPEMKMRLEREKRARAAEERMRRLQGGS